MGFLGRRKDEGKPARRTPGDRLKSAGAREYEASRHERRAERLESEGNAEGAQRERALAAEARQEPKRS